jgi:hypothetical protein
MTVQFLDGEVMEVNKIEKDGEMIKLYIDDKLVMTCDPNYIWEIVAHI